VGSTWRREGDAVSTRPEVLGYPSPTTSRYLILAATLLASGLFVGNWVHNQVRGAEWQRTAIACEGQPLGGPGLQDQARAESAFTSCMSDAERTRAAFAVGGVLVATAVSAMVLFLAPVVVLRRRRLRTPGPALSGAVDRFDELARQAGVAGRVRPLVGSSRQRDAFSFGAPGRYLVALPPAVAVRWRDVRLFDPLVRHELAHAKQRDIALAWLTRSVWYALVPILAVPIVTALVGGDTSVLGSYLWRAVVLGVVVALLSAALLRSREYGADLRAARWEGDPAAVEAVVGSARTGPTDAWRRLLARHPTPAQRVAVLRAPGLLVRSGFVDGLVGAFLGGLTVPLLVDGLSPALPGTGGVTRSYLLASLLLGPVLGASVGLSVWREALFGRVSGEARDIGPVATGVGIGLVAGQAASLSHGATGLTGSLTHPGWLLVSAVAGAGVTVLSAGLAQLWADAAPRLGSLRTCWIAALVVNAVLFTVLLWSTSLFQRAADGGGWALGRSELALNLSAWPMFWTVLGLGAAAVLPAVLARRAHTVPDWLVEGTGGDPWPRGGSRDLAAAALTALASGLFATGVIVTYRMVAGAASTAEAVVDRTLAYQWVIALAAAVAVAVVISRDRIRGPGLGAVVVPLAATVGSAGWLVLNLSLGAAFDLSTDTLMLRLATVLGWYVALVVVPFAYALARVPRASVRLPVAVATASALTVAAGALALDQRQHLIAPAHLSSSVLSQPLVPRDGDEAAAYLIDVVPVLTRQYAAIDQSAQGVLADPSLTAADKANVLEQQTEPAVSALITEWEGYTPKTDDVARAHAVALRALRTAALKYRLVVQALRTSDETVVAQVSQLGSLESQLWAQWAQWQTILATE
jgi:Zn-dependent protease with chaperone function